MKIARNIAELRSFRARIPGSLGFIPTMGSLHAGHGSLIEKAKQENDAVAISIFVNPTQFGPNEDLSSYPRSPERDFALAEKAGAELVFIPQDGEMYPEGFSSFVEVGNLSARWEGERRPIHFRGVATVVAKLFNLIEPRRAYFGEKDFQQLQIIRKMVKDLGWKTEIVGCPIVREPDGLAMSSRNAYLAPEIRKIAPRLFQTLQLSQRLIDEGNHDVASLLEAMGAFLEDSPFRLDYFAIVDPEDLEPLSSIDRPCRALSAAFLGKVRLIDNLELKPRG